MELDMKKVMILLQKKYSSIRELDRLTRELEEVAARGDGISAAMVLEMRGGGDGENRALHGRTMAVRGRGSGSI